MTNFLLFDPFGIKKSDFSRFFDAKRAC